MGPGVQVGVGQSTPLKVLTVPFVPFGQHYHSQRRPMNSEAPGYFQQLRKGRRT